MASQIRGANSIAVSQPVGVGGVTSSAVVRPNPYVCLFVKNETATATTIQVQVSLETKDSPLTDIGSPTDWFDYTGASFSVAGNSLVAFDLAPFSPQILRLKSSAATTLSAWYTAVSGR